MALPATEAFTDTDGTALQTHSGSWTIEAGGFNIHTNGLVNANGAGGENAAYWNADTFGNNHSSEITYVAQGTRRIGVGVRMDTGAGVNYYGLYGYNAGSYGAQELFEVISGAAPSLLGNNSTRIFTNDVLKLEASGTTLTAKINGSTASWGAVTDSSLASGAAGVVGRGDSNIARADSWTGDNLGGGGSTGTLARTNASDTSAASGTTTVTGTLATTNANDTLAASGSAGIVTGTLARTNAADTSTAAGTTTVTGALAATNAADTSAASGTTTVLGSSARTNAVDTLSAAGTTTVTGTLAATNGNDTLSASGIVGSPSGTLATTNANDTLSATGSTTITGALAYTHNADTSAAQGETGLQQGGGGGRKRKPFKSWDQRERERLEQLRQDEAARNKDKYGDMPKGLEDALKAAPSPYKRLSPQAVKAYQAARLQDDEDAFALIAGLL